MKRELVGERWEEIWERCLRGCEERADGKKMGGKTKKTNQNKTWILQNIHIKVKTQI